MDRSMNLVILMGNMGADITLHEREGRVAVATGRLATNHRTIDDDGNHGTTTVWHNIVAFGATATAMARKLHKGREVLIRGTIRASSYDRNGIKITRTEIHVNEFQPSQGASRRANVDEGEDPGELDDEPVHAESEAETATSQAA